MQQNDSFDRKRKSSVDHHLPTSLKRQNISVKSSSSSPTRRSHNVDQDASRRLNVGEALPPRFSREDWETEADFESQDDIIKLQKKAIWRQMSEYKRLFLKADDMIANLKEKEYFWEHNMNFIDTFWAKVSNELQIMYGNIHSLYKEGNISPESSPLLTCILSTEYSRNSDEKVDDTLKQRCQNVRTILTDIEKTIVLHNQHEKELLKAIQTGNIDNQVKNFAHSLEGKLEKTATQLEELQAKLLEKSAEVANLKSQNQRYQEKVANLEQSLETSESSLRLAEKKIDKLKQTAPVVINTNIPNPGPPEAEVATPAENKEDNSNAIDEYQIIASSRLKEIEKLRNERTLMLQEMHELKQKLSALPDEIVKESSLCQNLESQVDHLKQLNVECNASLQKMISMVENSDSERQEFKNKIMDEIKKQNHIKSEKIRQQEVDLTRIRRDREKNIHDLALLAKGAETKLHQVEEIGQIANSRSDRIAALESALTRLKMAMAENRGDHELMMHFAENSDSGEGGVVGGAEAKDNPFKFWRDQNRELKEEIERLEIKLKAFENAESNIVDKCALMESEALLKRDLSKLEMKLKDVECFFGVDPELNISSLCSDEKVKLLTEQLKKESDKVKELSNKLELGQKSEARLLGEVESMFKAWQILEQQNSRKVLDLTEKEQQISRLIAEKAKFDHKCSLLTKQNTTVNNLMSATKKQMEKQLDQIRKFEELEKNLRQQMQVTEKEKALIQSAEEIHRLELKKQSDQLQEARDMMERWKIRFAEQNNIIRDKVKLLESEIEAKSRLQEQVDVFKKKMDALRKDSDGSSNKTLENYMRLVRCSSCNNNLKSHCLMRCMHTFCKDCIDDMYNSRQRKCPSCGIPFGQQDIKAFFL